MPQGELASTEVTLREGGRVILQNSDSISPVLPVKMIPGPVSSLRGTQSDGKRAGSLRHEFLEADVIYLG